MSGWWLRTRTDSLSTRERGQEFLGPQQRLAGEVVLAKSDDPAVGALRVARPQGPLAAEDGPDDRIPLAEQELGAALPLVVVERWPSSGLMTSRFGNRSLASVSMTTTVVPVLDSSRRYSSWTPGALTITAAAPSRRTSRMVSSQSSAVPTSWVGGDIVVPAADDLREQRERA